MAKESFQKNIARGESILILFIILAILVRVVYYLCPSGEEAMATYPNSGYLWDLAAPYLQNRLLSIIGAAIGVTIIAISLPTMNVKHIIIRERTMLTAAFPILLFSCHPSFLVLNPFLIATFFVIWALSALLGAYQSDKPAFTCAHIAFILALGSLFVSSLLIFYPIFLIGFSIMRIFSLRSFIASFFSILFLYFPIFTFFLMTDNLEAFYLPFSVISFDSLLQLPLLSFDVTTWLVVSFTLFLLITFSINNYLNRLKDRIKIRAYIFFFTVLAVISILLYMFLNINPLMSIYVSIIALSLIHAHFFALVRNINSSILFIFCLFLYLAMCYIYVIEPIVSQIIILFN